MADLPGAFWGGWIAIITTLSLLALAWLVYSIYFSGDSAAHDESPVWDGNLREGAHPAPLWWFWLMLALLVFSVVYLMLYPGYGSFQGVRKWSQGGRLAQSYETYQDEFSVARQALLDAGYAQLQDNPQAMRAARGLFDRHCSACHGPDGNGQLFRFPNLRDGAWQWGGKPEQLLQTIEHGRQAVMPAWGAVLGADGVRETAQYVQHMPEVKGNAHPGRARYEQFCAACHGPAGEGNAALGAPSLADQVWLYGNSLDAISASIGEGRNGEMPAFGERLDAVQIKLLVAWLTAPPE